MEERRARSRRRRSLDPPRLGRHQSISTLQPIPWLLLSLLRLSQLSLPVLRIPLSSQSPLLDRRPLLPICSPDSHGPHRRRRQSS